MLENNPLKLHDLIGITGFDGVVHLARLLSFLPQCKAESMMHPFAYYHSSCATIEKFLSILTLCFLWLNHDCFIKQQVGHQLHIVACLSMRENFCQDSSNNCVKACSLFSEHFISIFFLRGMKILRHQQHE